MTNYNDIPGENLTEKVENAINLKLNYFVRPVNSTEDHYFFFASSDKAEEFASKFDDEDVEIWDLNDRASNEVLLED